MFAPMRQTRCSTSAADTKLLILIATSSLEQHGYELNHDALLDGATAANDLRNNQKKFKHLVRICVSIVNTLFALQYRAITRRPAADPDTAGSVERMMLLMRSVC
ncbi:MAG: hypothetical protein JOZ94_26130 [Xanthobacteraceae bacterium]|nr:hypothetical protein [Xanthobacteraceae bacterium]MBV9627802.1 hypothetical protein [Xanthobacteraceae bacterium]